MQLLVDRGADRLAVTLSDHPTADTLVVIFPAMGVPGSYYHRFASSLNDAGLAVATADLRGTGASGPRPSRASRYGYAELADDVGAVLDSLAGARSGRRTLLLGHSLGGQACMMRLAQKQDGVDGLILIAVGLPYWRVYGRQSIGVWGYTQGIGAVSAALGVWPGWGFGGRQARGVIRDWAYTARFGAFPPRLGVEERLADITLPVLAVSVDNDQYTPAPTVDFTVGKLPSARVRREHLTVTHAGMELDHFKWVKAGEPLAKLILDWHSPLIRQDG